MKKTLKAGFICTVLLLTIAAGGCKKTIKPATPVTPIVAPTPTPPPVVGVNTTVWAASSAPFPGETYGRIESWQRLNNRLKAANGGFGLMARRSYDTGIPANFAASGMADDVGIVSISIGEIKPLPWSKTADGSTYDQIKKFVQTIPADRKAYLVFFHEPEDNVSATNSIDDLQKAFAGFVTAVLDAKMTNVIPCYVLMSWTFNPKSNRVPENYNMAKYLKPEQLKEVVAGLDGYADDPTQSAKDVFDANFNKMGTWGFTRFGIFETACHASTSNPAARSTWVKGLGDWVNSRKDIEVVSWFNSGIGDNAGPTGWYLGNWYKNGTSFTWDDADGTIAAYSQLLKK